MTQELGDRYLALSQTFFVTLSKSFQGSILDHVLDQALDHQLEFECWILPVPLKNFALCVSK